MAIQLYVKTPALKSKAGEVSKEIAEVEKQWKKLQQTVKASKGYWEGNASNEHQKYLKEVTDDVNKIIKRMKEHPKELLQMAGIYDEAEASADRMAGTLPKDVI